MFRVGYIEKKRRRRRSREIKIKRIIIRVLERIGQTQGTGICSKLKIVVSMSL